MDANPWKVAQKRICNPERIEYLLIFRHSIPSGLGKMPSSYFPRFPSGVILIQSLRDLASTSD